MAHAFTFLSLVVAFPFVSSNVLPMTNTTTATTPPGWKPQIIHNHLNKQMKEAGIRSIKQLSEQSGVAYTLAKRVMAGAVPPSEKVVGRFAFALKCHPTYILGWEEPK